MKTSLRYILVALAATIAMTSTLVSCIRKIKDDGDPVNSLASAPGSDTIVSYVGVDYGASGTLQSSENEGALFSEEQSESEENETEAQSTEESETTVTETTVTETITSTETTTPSETTDVSTDTAAPETTTVLVTAEPVQTDKTPVDKVLNDGILGDALFIGDSRTVGIEMCGGAAGATFFCFTGMSVYNIDNNRVDVKGIGNVSLTEILSGYSFGKVFLMLGINEVGYPTANTVSRYSALVDRIRAAQPDAVIILQANLHVTKAKSDSDPVINNPALDNLNNEQKKLSNGSDILWIDANPHFDDALGNLSTIYCSDGAHMQASAYKEWGIWITNRTSELFS